MIETSERNITYSRFERFDIRDSRERERAIARTRARARARAREKTNGMLWSNWCARLDRDSPRTKPKPSDSYRKYRKYVFLLAETTITTTTTITITTTTTTTTTNTRTTTTTTKSKTPTTTTTTSLRPWPQPRMYGEARPARHVTCQYSYSSIQKFVQLMTHKEKKKVVKDKADLE